MPGRGSLLDISAVRSEIRSIQMTGNPAGVGDQMGEYSPIGNDGRMGSDAYGTLEDPTFTRIDAELVGQQGHMATKGQQMIGPDGTQVSHMQNPTLNGRTFHGGKPKRRED